MRHYQHRLPQLIRLERGDMFPRCKKCGERVSFEKAETNNKRLEEDQDLAA